MKNYLVYIFSIYLFGTAQSFNAQPTPMQPSGSGTSNDPYEISSLANLYWITQNPNKWGSHFEQISDIDASDTQNWGSTGWQPVGNASSNPFTGVYDGAGYVITNLFYSNSSLTQYHGFFGWLGGGEIKNLGLVDVNITGYQFVGGLVGRMENGSVVINCYTTGMVKGDAAVGGLVGFNVGNIQKSFSTCFIARMTGSNSAPAGGLVGNNNGGNIHQCYSIGVIDAPGNYAAGFAGVNNSSISNSYSASQILNGNAAFLVSGGSSSSYYNSEIAPMGGGASGLTTAEMQNQSSFSGWDFSNTWAINPYLNDGFPFLQWQTFDGEQIDVPNIGTTLVEILPTKIGFITESGTAELSFTEKIEIPNDLPPSGVALNKYWDIDVTNGSVKLRLYYEPDEITAFSGDPNIYHYDGADWLQLPTTTPTDNGDGLYYVETTSAYSSFSPVTIGDNANPLPVELISFEGYLTDEGIALEWETAIEVNNYGFEVERQNLELGTQNSVENWKSIGFVQGHGNSDSPKQYSFKDINPGNGTINYRLKQIDTDGKFEYSEIVEVEIEEQLPAKFELYQNYPNPFNPRTTIKFAIPASVKNEMLNTKLVVFDILGREVATLVNENLKPGNYEVKFNASGLPSGTYFYRIELNEKFRSVKKMLFLK